MRGIGKTTCSMVLEFKFTLMEIGTKECLRRVKETVREISSYLMELFIRESG